MDPIRIAIVGIGKIARDQHVPAICGNGAFSLAATVSPHDAGLPGVPHHASLDALLAQGPAVDAVALCTPPQVRYDLAAQALSRGAHVFLEKPPGATLAEVEALKAQADKVGATLFAAKQDRLREQMSSAFGATAFDAIEDQVKRNAEVFDRAMKMFLPFGQERDGEAGTGHAAGTGEGASRTRR